jgi:hypothetical protein
MNRQELIARAREIVNQDVVKGFTADFLKMAANDTQNVNRFEEYLKNISEQAWDPETEENTIATYSQELVDIVKALFPRNPEYPFIKLETKSFIKKKLDESLKVYTENNDQDSENILFGLKTEKSPEELIKSLLFQGYSTRDAALKTMIEYPEASMDVILDAINNFKKIQADRRKWDLEHPDDDLPFYESIDEEALYEAKEHTDDEIVDFNEIDLQHEYNKLNSLLFKGNLQPVTMLWNKRKGAHGVVKGTRNRSTGKITLTSLSMSQFLKVPYKFFKDVLAHEMVHVFWMQQDVNAKHGPLFVREMNRINSMGLGFNVSVRSDSSETSKFEMSQDVVRQGMELVCLLMNTDKEKNMLSVMKYDAYKKEAHRIIDIYDYLVNTKPKYRFVEGEFFLSTNPKLQARKIQRSFGSVSYTLVDESLIDELKQNAKFLCKFVINNDGPQVEGPDQPNPAPPKSLLGF